MNLLDKNLLKMNIEKAADYDFSNNKVFGSAYLVIQNNDVVYENCFGVTSLDKKEPVTKDTLFRLASMTKPITAVAALILIERGLLSLEDRVSKYLPEFKDIHIKKIDESDNLIDLGKPEKEITILNLLTHTSGFGENEDKTQKLTAEDKKSADNLIKFYYNMGLNFEPFSREQYSGVAAFDLLVKIIERITKTDYLSFLKKEIFEPIGMTNTTFIPSEDQWKNVIDMHAKKNGENATQEMHKNCVFVDYPCTHFLGGAGLVSSLSDYSKFAKMLLNNGKTETKQIITAETLKLMKTSYFLKNFALKNEGWGLGVRVITDESYDNLPVGAFGWSGAYGSHFWVDPVNKITAVFMKNSTFDGGAENESAINFEKAVKASFAI